MAGPQRAQAWGTVAIAVVATGAFALALGTRAEAEGSIEDTDGPQFVAECAFSHRAADDPIVHPDHPGASHRHDFFGSVVTGASSTADSLLAGDTTCATLADRSAYWTPSLLDGDELVEPWRAFAYYRLPAGVSGDQLAVPPLGLAMVAGDPDARVRAAPERVGWHCGTSSRRISRPPTCLPHEPLALAATFPDCWDGVRLDSDDHRSHVIYREGEACPPSHPVSIPQLVLDVVYQHHGDVGGLELASGSVRTGHADFLNGWDPDELARLVRDCLGQRQGCGLPPIRPFG